MRVSGYLKNSNKLFQLKYLIIIFFTLVSLSCRTNHDKKVNSGKPGNAEMENLNRYLLQKDRERIQNFIERKNLDMSESPTGLWYQVLVEGKGSFLTDNSKILIKYECSLLDGTRCYSSELSGPKELILGRSTMEPGLNEGLRLLKPGGAAIFILPPFLAFGLPGDGKMIPPRAVIVYNINILWPE